MVLFVIRTAGNVVDDIALGTRLLAAIETACPTERSALFTSNKSVDNIRMYERMGYVRFKEINTPADYKLVFMEKRRKFGERSLSLN